MIEYYCGCNGKWDIIIISNTQAEGEFFARWQKLKMVRVISQEDQLRGYRFGIEKTVYLSARDPKILQVAMPCFQGCKVISINEHTK